MTPEQIKQVYEALEDAEQFMGSMSTYEGDNEFLEHSRVEAVASARQIVGQYLAAEEDAQELVTVKDWTVKAVQEIAKEGGIDLAEEQAIQIVADHGHQFLQAARVAISFYLDEAKGFPEVMILGLEDEDEVS
jgi:hypothetical protein|tara:strand:+ start:1122 stop:1520 length:399 start_codon:yes stop_codon:yes gene_type:complete